MDYKHLYYTADHKNTIFSFDFKVINTIFEFWIPAIVHQSQSFVIYLQELVAWIYIISYLFLSAFSGINEWITMVFVSTRFPVLCPQAQYSM